MATEKSVWKMGKGTYWSPNKRNFKKCGREHATTLVEFQSPDILTSGVANMTKCHNTVRQVSILHWTKCVYDLVLGGINICSHDYCVKFNTVITTLYQILKYDHLQNKVKLWNECNVC